MLDGAQACQATRRSALHMLSSVMHPYGTLNACCHLVQLAQAAGCSHRYPNGGMKQQMYRAPGPLSIYI